MGEDIGSVEIVIASLAAALAVFVWRRGPRPGAWSGDTGDGDTMAFTGLLIYLLSQPFFFIGLRDENPALFYGVHGLVKAVCVIVALLFIGRLVGERDPLLLRSRPRFLRWALGLYALGFPLIFVLARISAGPDKQDATQVLIEQRALSGRLMLGFNLVLVTPFFEELVFRGLLQGCFRRRFGAPVAIAFSAALFTMVHDSEFWFPIVILALLLGWIYERCRTLWAPIAVHLTHNAVTFALLLSAN